MASVNARRARINIGCGKANDRVEAKISQPKDVRCSSQQNDVGGASTKSLALPPRLRVLGYTKILVVILISQALICTNLEGDDKPP
jgi:hypothetical protein